tara:strand:+ start:62 stop:313 length:252 start_codon:yes stop_codon:yes gene_type:complete
MKMIEQTFLKTAMKNHNVAGGLGETMKELAQLIAKCCTETTTEQTVNLMATAGCTEMGIPWAMVGDIENMVKFYRTPQWWEDK